MTFKFIIIICIVMINALLHRSTHAINNNHHQQQETTTKAKPLSPLLYNDISNLKLTTYIKNNLCIVAFYHPKISNYYKTYLKQEFLLKIAKHFNNDDDASRRKIIAATVNIGSTLHKKMATIYSIQKPFTLKLFLPGYNSFGIDLIPSSIKSQLLSSTYIIAQVEYIYNQRLNVTLPCLQEPIVEKFMDAVDVNRQDAMEIMTNTLDKMKEETIIIPTLSFTLYKKTMQQIYTTGTGQIGTDYHDYHRQLKMNFKGNEEVETILLTYER